ncbi:hypothetical protein [Dethiobacter alkaliphilus]|uniref:DUF4352 domain-containing protein n=1 Tax=Dethiobacter alkaliphilus AHT 1 TaxID=555088 RepID=C0GI01_DETAL|nr:hypothetical protein [Dethiobacter alkaliphilus]EEG77075.1 hypothetical protein DealDRAFT_2110 [Dethiobacter alkaliphilus AHT 1]
MKKWFIGVVLVVLLVLVSGCGGAQDAVGEGMREQPDPKTEQQPIEPAADTTSPDGDIEQVEYDLDIVEEWNGLKTEILGLGIASGVESAWQEEDNSDVVYVKFRIENTRDDGAGHFTTYPDQATLITSTGEQLEADMFESDNIGGDLYEGVIKDGIVFWVLERGAPFDISWVRLKWNSYDEAEDVDFDKWATDHDVRIEIE